MREEFRRELLESGYIHRPLPLHPERSLEAEKAARAVRKRRIIWEPGMGLPRHSGIGTIKMCENVCRVTAPTARDTVPYEDGATAGAFKSILTFPTRGENWEPFNRLSVWVRPDSPGSRSVHLRVFLKNEGTKPVPDPYGREGQHLANLVNHEWNQILWELSALPRDCVTQVMIAMDADGRDTSTGPEFVFEFARVELQQAEDAEKEEGWACRDGRIAHSMSGYFSRGPKTAVAAPAGGTFFLRDARGGCVLEKAADITEFAGDRYAVLDFGEIREPGEYYLEYGGMRTPLFEIGDRVEESAVWKALNFIFCERCGYPVPGKHGRCHRDVTAEHEGRILSFSGGWHDAGDMSQQMLQTAEVAQELFELAGRVYEKADGLAGREKDESRLLAGRLLEEGLWGLEFVLNSRFGDGYRASSVGLGLWTDGLLGTPDDVKARVHGQAFQNFFCAAVEAEAARILRESDPELGWKCLQTAKEDFRFAQERFRTKGIEYPILWEHTRGSGLSQYYAAAAWAAAGICRIEQNEAFRKEAEEYGRLLLACQETGTAGVPMRGFFYRDETHRTIVHYSHQGREHSFVQALCALCEALPDSPCRGEWERGIRLYGEYIKELFRQASPYGMLPAGIYAMSEAEDKETFSLLHLLVEHEQEKENYVQQLKAGKELGGGYYLRMFPVWFSFRGNSAIQLSMAKAAALAGNHLQDAALLDIAGEQLYWMAGKNPFCQSLIYGEGERYGQMDANYPGEMTGEMPVGIETRGNGDEPYWPSGNNATYKEVWLTTAGRYLSVTAELW